MGCSHNRHDERKVYIASSTRWFETNVCSNVGRGMDGIASTVAVDAEDVIESCLKLAAFQPYIYINPSHRFIGYILHIDIRILFTLSNYSIPLGAYYIN